MSKQIKPQRGYGITYVNHPIVAIYSIRRTRREAIEDWLDGETWAYWRKQGCRVVKVIVTQEQP